MTNLFTSVKILDTESTSLDVKQADIVELAIISYRDNQWKTDFTSLYGSRQPIPYASSAKNNISRNMLKDRPLFIDSAKNLLETHMNPDSTAYFVCHNVRYDRFLFDENFKRAGLDIQFTKDNSKWICTYRLAQALLSDADLVPGEVDDKIQFSQQYLRFFFDIDSSIQEIDPHRAESDAQVCGYLFEKLIALALDKGVVTQDNVLDQIWNLCWASKPIEKWPFGKHKGEKISDTPNKYILWAIQNMDALNSDHIQFNEGLADSIMKQVIDRNLVQI